MQRRDVLKTLGAAFLVSIGYSSATPQVKPRGWKTGFGLNGFASSSRKYKKTFPIWEVLDFATRTDFDGIELHGTWPMGGYPKSNESKRISALKRLYDAYGLQIFSIQTGAGGAFSPAVAAVSRINSRRVILSDIILSSRLFQSSIQPHYTRPPTNPQQLSSASPQVPACSSLPCMS